MGYIVRGGCHGALVLDSVGRDDGLPERERDKGVVELRGKTVETLKGAIVGIIEG